MNLAKIIFLCYFYVDNKIQKKYSVTYFPDKISKTLLKNLI